MLPKLLHKRDVCISHCGFSTLSLLFLYHLNTKITKRLLKNSPFSLRVKLFPCTVLQLTWKEYRDSKSPDLRDTLALWCCNYLHLDFDSTYHNSCC